MRLFLDADAVGVCEAGEMPVTARRRFKGKILIIRCSPRFFVALAVTIVLRPGIDEQTNGSDAAIRAVASGFLALAESYDE